jgi:RHS repeat-associated protein
LHGYEYDCANQLTRITVTNILKAEFSYDGLGRRRIRKDYAWQTNSWTLTNEVRYVYDGMLVIQERDGSNNPKVSYTRGLDMSGTMQGAGGIGGLLARTDAAGSAFYHTDGNGNVTMMVYSNGTVAAKYLYDPFGNPLGMWGPLATANTYRFSSMETYDPAGAVLYAYRFYFPNLQRWAQRDPIGENGGLNVYGFLSNDPINETDYLGMGPCEDKFRGQLKQLVKEIAHWKKNAKAHELEIKDRMEDLRKDINELKHKGDIPGAKLSETRAGHWELVNKHKAWKAAAEAKAQAAIDEFKRVSAEYAACRAAQKTVGSIAKKCVSALGKKTVMVAAFAWTACNDGVGAAVDDALWPVSEFWSPGPESMPSLDDVDKEMQTQ